MADERSVLVELVANTTAFVEQVKNAANQARTLLENVSNTVIRPKVVIPPIKPLGTIGEFRKGIISKKQAEEMFVAQQAAQQAAKSTKMFSEVNRKIQGQVSLVREQLSTAWSSAGSSAKGALLTINNGITNVRGGLSTFVKLGGGAQIAVGSLQLVGRGLNTLGSTVTNFGKLWSKTIGSRIWKNLAMSSFYAAFALGMVARAFGGLLRGITDSSGKFMDATTIIQGYSKATDEQMKIVRSNLLLLGTEFPYSANEAAQSMLELIKAGFGVAEAMKILPAVMRYATASQQELAEATQFAATIMLAYKKAPEEMAQTLDMLTAAAAYSAITDKQLSDALFGLLGRVSSMQAPLEDAAAVIAILGQRGQMGAKVGTRFAAAIQNLSAPSKEATRELEKLEVSIYDSTKAMRDPGIILVDLVSKLKDYDEQTQNVALRNIFGARAMGVIGTMLSVTSKEVEDMKNHLKDAGLAQDIFNRRMQESPLALKAAQSALESLQIDLGMRFSPILVYALNLLRKVFLSFMALPDAVKTGIVAITVLGFAFTSLFSIIFIGSAVFASLMSGLGAIGPIIGIVAIALASLGVTAAAAFIGFSQTGDDAFKKISSSAQSTSDQLTTILTNIITTVVQFGLGLGKLAIDVSQTFIIIAAAAMNAIASILSFIAAIFGFSRVTSAVSSGAERVSESGGKLGKSLSKISESAEKTTEKMSELDKSTIKAGAAIGTSVKDIGAATVGLSKMADATEELTSSTQELKKATDSLKQVDLGYIAQQTEAMIQAFRGLSSVARSTFQNMFGFFESWINSLASIGIIAKESVSSILNSLFNTLSYSIQGIMNGTLSLDQAWKQLASTFQIVPNYIRDFVRASLEALRATQARENAEKRLSDLQRQWSADERDADDARLEAERRLQDFRSNTEHIFNIFTWRRQKQLEREATEASRKAEDLRRTHDREREKIQQEIDILKDREKTANEVVDQLKALGEAIIAMREREAREVKDQAAAEENAADKIQSAWEKAAGGISVNLEELKNKFANAFNSDAIQTQLDEFKGFASALFGIDIPEDLDKTSEAFQGGYEKGQDYKKTIDELKKSWDDFSAAIETISPIISGIGDAFKSLRGPIGQFLLIILGLGIISIIINKIKGLWLAAAAGKGILGNILSLIKMLGSGLAILAGIINIPTVALVGIIAAFAEVGIVIWNLIQNIQAGQDAWTALSNAFRDSPLGWVIDRLGDLVDWLSKLTGINLRFVKEFFKNLFPDIKGLFDELGKFLQHPASWLLENASNWTKELISSLAGPFGPGLKSAIESGLKNLRIDVGPFHYSYEKGFWMDQIIIPNPFQFEGDILPNEGGIPPSFPEIDTDKIVKDTIDPLKEIPDSVEEVWEKTTEKFDQGGKDVEKVWGVRSPSQRSIDIGESIVRGLEVGLRGILPTLKEAFNILSIELLSWPKKIFNLLNNVIVIFESSFKNIELIISSSLSRMWLDIIRNLNIWPFGIFNILQSLPVVFQNIFDKVRIVLSNTLKVIYNESRDWAENIKNAVAEPLGILGEIIRAIWDIIQRRIPNQVIPNNLRNNLLENYSNMKFGTSIKTDNFKTPIPNIMESEIQNLTINYNADHIWNAEITDSMKDQIKEETKLATLLGIKDAIRAVTVKV